jgi:hypothetical protein
MATRAPTTDELPSPLPPLTPRPSGALTFSQPWPNPEPADSPSPSAAPSDEQGAPPDDAPSSSTGSSAKPASVTSAALLREGIRTGVLSVGQYAHQLLARDEADVAAGVWLADADDAETIGDPIANVLNRRGGIGAAGNPDIADAITCLIGLALYVAKQFARRRNAKTLRQEGTMGARTGAPVGDPTSGAFEAATGEPGR